MRSTEARWQLKPDRNLAAGKKCSVESALPAFRLFLVVQTSPPVPISGVSRTNARAAIGSSARGKKEPGFAGKGELACQLFLRHHPPFTLSIHPTPSSTQNLPERVCTELRTLPLITFSIRHNALQGRKFLRRYVFFSSFASIDCSFVGAALRLLHVHGREL